MAKWCSNLKLNWVPGRPDILSPLVSIATKHLFDPDLHVQRGFWPAAPGPYCTDRPSFLFLSEVHLEAFMRGVYVTNVQSYPEECRGELRCFGVDWSWEHLVTKEAKPWAPEDVQRWHVCDVLVAVELLLLIGCYRRLPFDLLGSRGHVKKKRPKPFSENSAKSWNHFHGVSRCWVSRFMRVRGYGTRLRSYCPTCDQTKRFSGTYAGGPNLLQVQLYSLTFGHLFS